MNTISLLLDTQYEGMVKFIFPAHCQDVFLIYLRRDKMPGLLVLQKQEENGIII